MSTIKPMGPVMPGAPAAPVAGGAAVTSTVGVSPAKAASADPTAAVLGELRAGRITPDEAVGALTRAAIEKTGCPAAMRPVIAQKIEALLRRDPTLGAQIADALVAHLGARAAGVVLVARHACLSLRGERQGDAAVVTQSFAGAWRDDATARAEFLLAVGPVSR